MNDRQTQQTGQPPSQNFRTITHRSDFLLAAAKGKKFITGTFILQMLARKADHPVPHGARFGFTVTKKMGNAVIRNRIKRRLREAVRMAAIPHALEGCDYVLISRNKALDCPFSDLTRDMEFAFSRIPFMKESQQHKPKPH
jgi:ribonuclease P protein component